MKPPLRAVFAVLVMCWMSALTSSLFTNSVAGEYWVLKNTNMVPALKDIIELRSFIEPEQFIFVTTNWSQATPLLLNTNGYGTIYEVGSRVTNITYKFTVDGTVVVHTVAQGFGPVIAHRSWDIPMPMPQSPPLPTRIR